MVESKKHLKTIIKLPKKNPTVVLIGSRQVGNDGDFNQNNNNLSHGEINPPYHEHPFV